MYTEFLEEKSLGKCPHGELKEYERITKMDLRFSVNMGCDSDSG
jgi:hypothetical protein